MQKNKIFTAVAAAVALSSTSAFAEGGMEKCMVVKDGKGLIKEHKADCKGATHSCAGQNEAGDPKSWILVPVGECEKINAGNFSGVSQEIKDKIDLQAMEDNIRPERIIIRDEDGRQIVGPEDDPDFRAPGSDY